jgi:hypothetical protein
MKINADGLLGNANKISAKRTSSSENEKTTTESRADRADIATKVDVRLDAIQGEMRDLQTTISKNQAIRDGLSQMMESLANGGDTSTVVNKTIFDNKKVLADYLAENDSSATESQISEHNKIIDSRINDDTTRLKKLMIETENIFASNLGKSDKSVSGDIEKIMSGFKSQLADISAVNPEKVMRLVK